MYSNMDAQGRIDGGCSSAGQYWASAHEAGSDSTPRRGISSISDDSRNDVGPPAALQIYHGNARGIQQGEYDTSRLATSWRPGGSRGQQHPYEPDLHVHIEELPPSRVKATAAHYLHEAPDDLASADGRSKSHFHTSTSSIAAPIGADAVSDTSPLELPHPTSKRTLKGQRRPTATRPRPTKTAYSRPIQPFEIVRMAKLDGAVTLQDLNQDIRDTEARHGAAYQAKAVPNMGAWRF